MSIIGEYTKVDEPSNVGPDAVVPGCAKVLNNAEVFGQAKILDNAVMMDRSSAYDDVVIRQNAKVAGMASIFGAAIVSGHAKVEDASIRDRARVRGNAFVRGQYTVVGGHAILDGYANVWGPTHIHYGRSSPHCWTLYRCVDPTTRNRNEYWTLQFGCTIMTVDEWLAGDTLARWCEQNEPNCSADYERIIRGILAMAPECFPLQSNTP